MFQTALAGLLWLSAIMLVQCGTPVQNNPDILTLEVASQTVACTGEAPQRCLLVRERPEEEWTRLYDPIQGFAYEEGYRYTIRVERQRDPEPRADASEFTYTLLEVLSRVRDPEIDA